MRKITRIAAGVSTAVTGLYLSALPIFAANNVVDTNVSATLCPTIQGFKIPGCGTNAPSISQIVSFGINILLFVAFVAALGFLIFGGIRWIISGGDKEGTAKAKGTVTAALIGLVIVLASWVLLNVVLQLITGNSVNGINVPPLGS